MSQEIAILHEFGDVITKSDHKYRADRLLYKEQVPAALREAVLAGPDEVLLAKARAAVIANAASDAAIAAVPKALQKDPGLIFSRIQKARRANRTDEAADLMLAAPRDPAQIIDGDEWWTERRLVARKLLDLGETRRAYRVAAEHSAESDIPKMEAEFHAGWIALRFLDDPKLAAGHFRQDRGARRDADLEIASRLLAGARRRGCRQHARLGRLLCRSRAISDQLLRAIGGRPDRTHGDRAAIAPAASGGRATMRSRSGRRISVRARRAGHRAAAGARCGPQRSVGGPGRCHGGRSRTGSRRLGHPLHRQDGDPARHGARRDRRSPPSASPNSSRCAIRPISPPSMPSPDRKASSIRSRCPPPAPRA